MNTPLSPDFRLGVVTGLQFEADIVRRMIGDAVSRPIGRDSISVAWLGPGPDSAGNAARSLLEIGATALLSFGVAGGCDPALPPGATILATGVRDTAAGGEMLFTNRGW